MFSKGATAIVLLWLAVTLPANSRYVTDAANAKPLPPESCTPPALSPGELSIAARNDGTMDWTSNLEVALQSARTKRQQVLIYFRAEDCTKCDKLQVEVLSDSYIQIRLRAFTLVRVDIHTSAANAKTYGVTNVPALVRLSSDGRYERINSGRLTKDGLLTFLRQ